MGYAEMGGVGNEEEAAARMSAALGLPSYPLPVNETLRLCTWLKSRPASSGYLGKQTSLKLNLNSQYMLTYHNFMGTAKSHVYVHTCTLELQMSLYGYVRMCVYIYV